MKSVDPNRVAVYIRWSTEDQGLGHTLAIQSEACRHYCLSRGWQVRDHLLYVDDGWSGGTLRRPALDRLRADVTDGKVAAVMVYKLDRLSRNIKDIIALVLDEWEGRCTVHSTMEPIDTASDTGKLTFTLLSSFADFERGTIRARTLSGKRKNAEQGRNAGTPYPYGYQRGEQTGTYRIVEAEAAVVQLIFELYLSGMGCKPIAEHLNRLGIPDRQQGPGRKRLSPGLWSNTAVLRILKNPVYTGRLVYSRKSRNPRRGKDGEPCYVRNEAAAIIETESPHIPAVIDAETFTQAQRIRESRLSPNFGRRASTSPHLLSGLIWCACGHSLVGRKSPGRSGNYYWCSGRKNKGAGVCRSGQIRADVLDGLVLERLEGVYGSEQVEITPGWQETADRRRRMLQELLLAAETELEQVRHARRRLSADYRSGVVTGQAYQHLFNELADSEQRLQAAALQHQEAIARTNAEAHPLQECPLARVSLRDHFATLIDAQKKLLLKHLVHRITAYREQGSQHLRMQIDYTGGP